MGFTGGLDGKESTCNAQMVKNPPADYTPWGSKDTDMTEQLSIAHFQNIYTFGSLVDNR